MTKKTWFIAILFGIAVLVLGAVLQSCNFAYADIVGGQNVYDDTKSYTDSTVLTLTDINNNLHTLNSLPDGVRDEYNFDNNLLTQKVKVLTVSSGTGWVYQSVSDTVCYLLYNDTANAWGLNANDINARCNIMPASLDYTAGTFKVARRINDSQMVLKVLKSELSSLDNAGAVAWINNQISLHGNIVFMYELATPHTFNISPVFNTFVYYNLSSNDLQPILNNNIFFGVTTGGNGTPSEPVSLLSVQNINILYELNYPTTISNTLTFVDMCKNVLDGIGFQFTNNNEFYSFVLCILLCISILLTIKR